MNISEHLSGPARIYPHQPAILFDSYAITYRQLHQQSVAAANHLRQSGVTAGDRVAIMLPNVPAFAVWYYGALRLGAIAVSLSTRLAESEIDFVIQDCQATTLIVLADSKDHSFIAVEVERTLKVSVLGDVCDNQTLESVADENHPDHETYNADAHEPALILYTSGTTGFPKGATLSHGNVRSNVCAFNHLCQMSHEDVILLTVPLFHCFGQNALLNSGLNAGATLVLQSKFDPQESKRLIADHRVTQLYGVPAMFQMLNDCCTPHDLCSVIYCFTAASTMPIQVAQKWQQTYKIPIHEGYGLTETSPFASYNHRLKFVPGSIGMPIDNVEMKIVDTETKTNSPPGELGEIAIRGPNVMLGYWNRPEDTAAAIVDGWFYSGDIGRVDDEGYFFIVDRVKDMISIGGLKVYPAEVERVLLDHAGVKQTAVVGFSGGVLGEEVVAFVVTADDAEPQSTFLTGLKAHARNHLANYKTPKHFFIVDELPRNPSGKVLKTELRNRQTDLLASATSDRSETSPAHRSQMGQLRQLLNQAYPTQRQTLANDYLQNLIVQISGDDQPPATDQRLMESGMDSLMLVELSHRLQIEVGDAANISATVIFDHPTIGELAEFLIGQMFDKQPSTANADTLVREANESGIESKSVDLESEIAAMPEDQVLEALLKELEDDTP